MPPLIVLADANVLVKDVVSFAFFDLVKAGAIDLRWTPQIEVEYAKHRARLRAGANQRESTADDLVWAQKRLATIKKHLVPGFQLPGWDDDGDRLELLRSNKALAPLLRLPDPDDVHVALAAADWAQATGRDVVLATDNLKDLPAKVLAPFGVVPLHPGDVLQLVYQMDPEGTASSLQKTAADFKNPAFSLLDMLASIKSPQQFDNQELAAELAVRWELAVPGASQGTTKARTKQRSR